VGEADCRIGVLPFLVTGSEMEDTLLLLLLCIAFQIFKPQTTSLAVRELLVIFLLSLGFHAYEV